MSEFSGKQFYGFSTNHNTHLGATTDNFDFQHLRPGYLQRVSQKLPKEMEAGKERHSTRPSSYSRRATTPELLADIGMLKRDTDVETQIASNKLTSPIAAIHSRQVIRELSDQEIENLITKVKPPADMSPRTKKKYYPNLKSLMESSQQTLTNRSGSTSPLISPNNRNPGILRKLSQDETFVLAQEEDLNKTYNLATNFMSPSMGRTTQRMEYFEADNNHEQVPQIIDNVRMEEYRKPQAKWVEILEPQKEIRSEIPVTRSPTTQDVSMHYHMPAMLMTEAIADNVRMAGSYMNVNPSEDNATTDTYIVEESDLEFEMFDRENYMKYNKTKPLPEDMLNLSIDEDGSLAEFIAIESGLREMDVTYLRNKSPLRFTEVTEDTQEDTHGMKVYINSRRRQQNRLTVEQFPQCSNDILELHEPLVSTDRCSSKPLTKPCQQAKRQTKTLREEHLQRTFERLAGGGAHSTRSHTKCARSLADSAQSNRSSRAHTNTSYSPQTRAEVELCPSRLAENKAKKAGSLLKPKSLKISKSIEDFKLEKSNIYKKMSATQEKIIEVLDKLRISLLELNVPDNSFDKTKRQRNAFEFAVRFSRNFLYPLKGMLEDIKSTPIEQFNSLTSNDACLRVCHLYSLLLQSVNTYQKQLRYFLLDHVPQKLPILIEMIYMATLECLEKQIFSREDIIIDCLQQRCTKFLDFLQDLEEGRLNTVRENHRKLTLDKATPKYDLKMFMNKLNMYEPKLVPKAATHRKKTKPKRPITSVAIDEVKDSITERPKDENIPTQIQRMPIDNKSSTQFNMGAGDCAPPVLDKTVVEALQNVTKEQVRKVLEPILASLGSALGKQNDSQAIEAFASAFQSKVFSTLKGDEQLNSDNKCSEENKTADVEISSMDSLGDTTCKPLKAAKQTKTQRQQNKRRRGEALAAASKVNAANDYGDDDDDNDDDDDSTNNNINNDGNSNNNNNNSIASNSHTKSNANNRCCSRLSQSSRHSINQQRWRETDHKQHPRGREESHQTPSPPAPTTTTRTPKTLARGRQSEESLKINKSTKKLMNEVHREDQIDKELPNANEEDMEEEKQQQQQQRQRHRERLSEKREQTYAKQLLQKRAAAAAAKSQQFENHDEGFSCPSTHSTDYTHPYTPPALGGSSSSDSEGGHNPKLKKHLLNQYNSTGGSGGGGGISNRLLTSQSFSNSPHCRQLYTQTAARNATNAVASTLATLSPPPSKSLHCLARQRGRSATTSTKSNLMQRKKRDPAAHPPPAPSVTPSSSSDHLRVNNKIRETLRQKLDDDDSNSNFRFSLRKDSQRLESLQLPIDELKIPLTANVSDLLSMRMLEETLPSPESYFDESDNVEISSMDSLGDTTCKPLKAAKQTKTQRQQNKRRRGEALAAASKVNAANDYGDDDDDNDGDDDSTNNNINNDGNSNNNNNNSIASNSHTKSNANNRCCSRLSQSSRHSINQQRWRETDHKQHPRGREESHQTPSPPAPTTTTRTPKTLASGRQSEESLKINKSTKKLMNEVHSEDQIDKELPNANEEDMEEEKQQQQQQRQRHREMLSEKREQTYAKQLLRKRAAAAAAKSQQFENHDEGFSCPSTHSTDYTHPYTPPALGGSSSSDSEGGHNPKLKKHLLKQYNSTGGSGGGGGISNRLLTSQSFSNSPHCRQLYTQTASRNATNAVASTLATLSPPPSKSLHCLARQRGRSATTSTKSNPMQRKKRDPAAHPPPAPSVTPSSSSDHLRVNNKIRETLRQKLDDDDRNSNFRFSLRKDSQRLESLQLPIDELKIPLTANVSDLLSMRMLEETLPSPESYFDESDNGNVTERGNLKLDSLEFRHNALPLYTNNSPYKNRENTSRRLRPLPEKELQKLKPKPATKKNSTLMKENRSPSTQLETPNTNNISKQHDEELRDPKPDLHFEEMIRERNQFLELCQKNRYYKNPNYAEPWKVFSIISERLLNEVMDTVQNDFDAGVSKFVEDFLALEIRTQ